MSEEFEDLWRKYGITPLQYNDIINILTAIENKHFYMEHIENLRDALIEEGRWNG